MANPQSDLGYWSRRIDWPLVASVCVLLGVGLLAVTSAVMPKGNAASYIIKQLAAVGVGFFAMTIFTSLNYQIFRPMLRIIYVLSVILLMAVLVIGHRIHGAKSWIVLGPISIEPVEIARIGFVLVLAGILDRPEKEISSIKLLLGVFILAGIHILLILMEPYLGGTLVYMPVLLGMLFFAGVRPIYLLALIFYGLVAVGVPILSIYFSVQPQLLDLHPVLHFFMSSTQGGLPAIELLALSAAAIFSLWWLMWKLRFRIPWQYPLFLSLIVGLGMYSAHMAQHFIKDYQRKRIMVFLSPGFDPLGAGYHILQSEIAVGSGRFFGKGLFSGTQTHLGFLPEQHTDFIFSVIGEEMGFMWAAVVILAFGILAWRAFFIARETQDRFGALIAVGIGCVFAFECVMNIGMVIGILPVTGLALPFVSYGGSHMVSSFIAIGLLLSINFRRYIY